MQIVDSTRRTRSAHRRGVVMVEFAFCLPMLLLVIALVFFFGKAMAQKLHVVEANRCDTWRHVEPSISPPTVVELNRVFFGDKATLDRQAFEGEPADVIENFVTLAGGVSQQAMALAQRTVQDSYDHGRLCSLSAEVPNTVPLWRQLHLEGPIKSSCVRDGVPWRRRQASCLDALCSQFFSEMDGEFKSMPGPALQFSQVLRDLYLRDW